MTKYLAQKATPNSKFNRVNSSLFELYMPRMAHGSGSNITLSYPEPDMTAGRYIAYVTYDQGSEKEIINPGQTTSTRTLGDELIDFWEKYWGSIAMIGIAIILAILAIIIHYVIRSRHNKRHDNGTSLLVNDFLAKLEKLKEHGIISENELVRIKQAMTTKKSVSVDDFLSRLAKVKE
jgi:hypothetical protein